jgi:hypothetical protein
MGPACLAAMRGMHATRSSALQICSPVLRGREPLTNLGLSPLFN